MITIRKPEIVELGDQTRIQSIIDFDGAKKLLWFEVPTEYAQYLCPERSDAYVIGLLNHAMRHKQDITCEVPMGEELHYRISTYLIPSLANHSKGLYHTKIVADLDSTPIQNAGGVGTGMSCGIDAMHVMANEAANGDLYPSLKVTHLVHYRNLGIHGFGQRGKIMHEGIEGNARKFANEVGLPIISTDSNYAEIMSEGLLHWHHALTHTYSSIFATYMLQKLWKIYYYASGGHDFSGFSLVNSEKYSPANYELLSLDCFSTQSLKIFSEGGAKTRFDKTKTVVTYPPAKKYLNVCIYAPKNCGKCVKCVQTLASLDALNQLDEFRAVFDVDYYKSHRWQYYCRLYGESIRSDTFSTKDVCRVLSPRMNLFHRLGGLFVFVKWFTIDIVEWCSSKVPSLSKRYSEHVDHVLIKEAEALARNVSDEKNDNF